MIRSAYEKLIKREKQEQLKKEQKLAKAKRFREFDKDYELNALPGYKAQTNYEDSLFPKE